MSNNTNIKFIDFVICQSDVRLPPSNGNKLSSIYDYYYVSSACSVQCEFERFSRWAAARRERMPIFDSGCTVKYLPDLIK